jgi:4'-phosphopantetheinyl transferase
VLDPTHGPAATTDERLLRLGLHSGSRRKRRQLRWPQQLDPREGRANWILEWPSSLTIHATIAALVMEMPFVLDAQEDVTQSWRPVTFPMREGGLRIEPREVHVWRAELRQAVHVIDGLRATLDAEELSRANRFVFERHRLRYVAAHGMLRHLLSAYVGIAPDRIELNRARYGKPYLLGDGDGARGALRFNLAHSSDLMLVAIGVRRELGVDLEFIGRRRDVAGIARHFFSPNEVTTLTALPADERLAAFYRCWTRKEAYIKACGRGLKMRLDDFDVSLEPGVSRGLLRSALATDEPERWRFADLRAGPGFEAALAVEGHEWRLGTYEIEIQERKGDAAAGLL